jgi:hypothetical protein
VGRVKSTLARGCEVVLDGSMDREICPLNLALTASTTVAMAIGDALGACLTCPQPHASSPRLQAGDMTLWLWLSEGCSPQTDSRMMRSVTPAHWWWRTSADRHAGVPIPGCCPPPARLQVDGTRPPDP